MSELPWSNIYGLGTAIGTPLIDNKRTKVTDGLFQLRVIIPAGTGTIMIMW